MKKPMQVLHLEDNISDSELLEAMLDDHFELLLTRVETEADFQKALARDDIDLIISDFTLPSYNGLRALTLARSERPDIPFIFFSGTLGEEAAVETLTNGATDYVLKHRPQKLVAAIERAMRERAEKRSRLDAEEALRRREEWFRTLTENALDIISIINRDGSFAYNSPSIERILGYPPERLLGQIAFDVVHPEDLASARAEFERALRSPNENIQTEYRVRHLDGSWRHLELIGKSLPPGHPIDGVVINARDVTQRVHDQEQLNQQAALLNEARDAIIVTDAGDAIRYWNKGAEQLYGWSREEAVGRTARELLFLGKGDWPAKSSPDLFEKGRWEGELPNRSKDDRELIVLSRRTLLRDASGEPKAVLILQTDITEKKEAEERFLRAQRLECIGVLAGGVAHDLNNILAPVLMGAELLRSYTSDPEALSILETIQVSSQRGTDIVRQVLSFARGVSGKSDSLDLHQLVREVTKLLKETFPKTIQFQVHCPPDLRKVMGNATELHQVLMNLCVNARDAMPAGGLLQISARNTVIDKRPAGVIPGAGGEFVRLTIADSGTGIPPNVRKQIFEPFYTTKEEGKGTGLGLSTVLSIVQRHSGFIELESEVGEGTRFHIYLPAAPQETRTGDSQEIAPVGNAECILLVDDETAILEMARVILEDANYEVHLASEGVQALQLFARHANEYRLVITDGSMPIMDGRALTRELRRNSKDVPIICTTGQASGTTEEELKAAGVSMILSKPYSRHQLLMAVAKALKLQPA